MLGMLNEVPGNTKSTLADREKCCITPCSLNRNYFVITASLHVSSGSPEPRGWALLCCSNMPGLRLISPLDEWLEEKNTLVLYFLSLVEVVPEVFHTTVFQPDRIKDCCWPCFSSRGEREWSFTLLWQFSKHVLGPSRVLVRVSWGLSLKYYSCQSRKASEASFEILMWY